MRPCCRPSNLFGVVSDIRHSVIMLVSMRGFVCMYVRMMMMIEMRKERRVGIGIGERLFT